jgi:hypothetical protein
MLQLQHLQARSYPHPALQLVPGEPVGAAAAATTTTVRLIYGMLQQHDVLHSSG